jgi:hypothetical protein
MTDIAGTPGGGDKINISPPRHKDTKNHQEKIFPYGAKSAKGKS